jgi:predicted kinase
MNKLYLLCGMPFSGKTTLLPLLCEYLNCPYISLDDINKQRGLNGGDGISVQEWRKLLKNIKQMKLLLLIL